MDKPPQSRVFYVDAIRAWAILWVVASHAFAGICWGMNNYPRPIWWIFNLLDSVIRICVPLFVMISGKLLLGSTREEPYLDFVWRRYSKLLTPFFVWSMIYAYYHARVEGPPFSFGHAVLQFLQGPTEGHLYFMYIILGLYLLAPVLRAYVRAASSRDLSIFLGLWMGFLTVQFFFPAYAGSGPGATLLDYGGYFLLGYYLDKADLFSGKISWPLAASAAIVLFNAYATYRLAVAHGGALNEKFYYGTTPLVAAYAAAFFIVLKNIDYESLLSGRPHLRGAVMHLSLESYNIYLDHIFFLYLFTAGHLGFVLSADTGPNAVVGVTLTTAAVLAASLGFSLLIKKLPLVSRLFVVP